MSQSHILLVDSNQWEAVLIAEHLTEVGYRVTVKSDLPEALNWLNCIGNLPDLIICDGTMSGTNKHRFIRQMRPDPANVYPLVILLGGEDDIDDMVAGFEAGADDYLVQPVNAIELGLRVRALLTRTQAFRTP